MKNEAIRNRIFGYDFLLSLIFGLRLVWKTCKMLIKLSALRYSKITTKGKTSTTHCLMFDFFFGYASGFSAILFIASSIDNINRIPNHSASFSYQSNDSSISFSARGETSILLTILYILVQ